MTESLEVRVGRAALAITNAVKELEHAIADADTTDDADLIRKTLGACYGSMDRANATAHSRYWQLVAADQWPAV